MAKDPSTRESSPGRNYKIQLGLEKRRDLGEKSARLSEKSSLTALHPHTSLGSRSPRDITEHTAETIS
jgi:hypothetical protein